MRQDIETMWDNLKSKVDAIEKVVHMKIEDESDEHIDMFCDFLCDLVWDTDEIMDEYMTEDDPSGVPERLKILDEILYPEDY